MKKNILVVAPDAEFRASLARALLAAGYGVELAEGAKRAREVAASEARIDLGILAPDARGGIDERLCQELAEKTGGLFVVGGGHEARGLLSQAANVDVIASRDAGDILARIDDVLRRRRGNGSAAARDGAAEKLSFAGLAIDLDAHAAFDADGREIALTRAEFALLVAFARAPGRALTRDQLRLAVTGDGAEAYDRSIDVMVWRLRRKIEDDPKAPRLIVTIPGVGYKFAARKPAASALPSGDHRPAIDLPHAPAPDPPRSEAPAAERRQLSVLACEFVGVAALSARLDPEDLGTVVARWRERCGEVVAAHQGRIARFLGNGMVAHFGDPLAHEHDAEHAVRAGLALLAASLPDDSGAPVPPALRIGVASGLVVVGQGIAGGSAWERAAVGEPPYVAERLASAAEPGALIIAESTHRLTEGLFECQALGVAILEEQPAGVPIWQVVRPSMADSRFEARRGIAGGTAIAAESLSPFVGRGRELDVLMRGRDQATRRLILIDIVGEAGIGKSRLLHEFRGQLIGDGVFVLLGSCWPDSQQTPFRPFIEVVRRSFRIAGDDSDRDAAMKFQTALEFLGLPGAENVGLLMNLLGRAPPPGSLSGLDGVLIGLRTRDLLLGLLRERSRIAPLTLMIEDLHWIDRASEELLAQLVAAAEAPPMLVLNTCRPEYRPPWAGRDNVSALVLAPLSAPDTTRIVESRLGAMDRSISLVRTIVDRAEGNPLFAEEIANFLVERAPRLAEGRASAVDVADAVPASLQTLLTARVDRLTPSDRALLQAAAVIGRRFYPELLASVTASGADLAPQLSAMADVDLIRRDENSNEFVFKHALVRDALYQSLTTAARAGLHLRIAEEMERRVAARPIEAAEILAHHYSHTDRRDKTVDYLALAGRKSLGIYSLSEAEGFLRKALAAARAEDAKRLDDQVLTIMVDLAKVLTMRFKSSEIAMLVEPETEGLDAFADRGEAAIVLYFYSYACYTMGRFAIGRRAAESALHFAARSGNPRADAYAKAGIILLSSSTEPLPLEELARLADSAYAESQGAEDIFLSGSLMMVTALNYFSRGLNVESAIWARRLLDFGRQRRDPRSTAIALWVFAWQAMVAGDFTTALHYGEASVDAASTDFDRILGRVAIGTAKLLTGRVAEGRQVIYLARSVAEASGALYLLSATDGPVGVAMVLSGEIRAGLAWLEARVRRAENEIATGIGIDYLRMHLAEVYIGLLKSERRLPLRLLLKTPFAIFAARLRAARRAEGLLRKAMENPQFSEGGMFRARIAYDLGLVYKATKRPELAREQLALARRAAAAQQAGVMLTKIDAALAAL